MTFYPKVLVLTNCSITDVDAHGALMRNYFHDWPKECLAHIYQEDLNDCRPFCGSNYKLTVADRRCGRYYKILKSSIIGTAARRHEPALKKRSSFAAALQRLVYSGSHFLLQSGLWEFIFAPRVSSNMAAWIKSFAPDVLYVNGYSLFYVWLARRLHHSFSMTICLHMLDDWPNTLYSRSPFAFVMRPVVRHAFKSLADVSGLRICIGSDMRDEYWRRYGLQFVSMLNCDDMDRYSTAPPRRTLCPDVLSLVYSGSLGVGRWRSLLDICEAAVALRANGMDIRITAYTPDVPPNVVVKFSGMSEVLTLAPPVRDHEMPGILKGADILLLTESFNKSDRTEVRLSIATKAHLYMMAQQPILVYGPPDVAVVRYAQAEGWAHVVTSQSALAQELRRLAYDATARTSVVGTARRVALRNHSAPTVREHLWKLMRDAVLQAAQK